MTKPPDLFARAAASEDSATRQLGAEIEKSTADLKQRLRNEAETELAALEKRRAELRAVIHRRTEQKATKEADDSRPAAIRAWAIEQGMGVKKRGRIAAEIVELYDAWHGQL